MTQSRESLDSKVVRLITGHCGSVGVCNKSFCEIRRSVVNLLHSFQLQKSKSNTVCVCGNVYYFLYVETVEQPTQVFHSPRSQKTLSVIWCKA